MEPVKMTSKEYLKGLQVLYLALVIGTVFFAAIVMLFQDTLMGGPDNELVDLLLILAAFFSIAGVIASSIVFKQRLDSCRAITGLYDKLTAYRSAVLLRLALLEAPSYLIIVAYMLTGNMILMGLLVLLLIIFLPESVIFRTYSIPRSVISRVKNRKVKFSLHFSG